tara:strand:- start:8406 stop:8711 length:306 start_codon:yes stop_codon:yes gene_type:complete
MSTLNREQIKSIVTEALRSVADFNGDIENFTFEHFQEYSKQVFTNKLVELINAAPFYNYLGVLDSTQCYRVVLSNSIVNSWVTLEDCINYIEENIAVGPRE